MLLHVVRNVVSLAIGIARARGSAERIWGDFFILVWRILGKLSAKFSANFHSEIFAQIFQTVVSPGFQATGWHPKQSRPKFTLKLVGIPLQFHIFGPKNVSRRLSADGEANVVRNVALDFDRVAVVIVLVVDAIVGVVRVANVVAFVFSRRDLGCCYFVTIPLLLVLSPMFLYANIMKDKQQKTMRMHKEQRASGSKSTGFHHQP